MLQDRLKKREPQLTSQEAAQAIAPKAPENVYASAKNTLAAGGAPKYNAPTAPASAPKVSPSSVAGQAINIMPQTTTPKVTTAPTTQNKPITSDEVFNMFREQGLYGTIDSRDFGLIIANPEYGLKLLDAKKRYNAEGLSAEHRDAIAADFENIRLAEIESQKPGQSQQNGGEANWQGVLDTLIAQYANNKFSYDAKSDPRYALAEEYAQNAMKNQMAESAMLSGGYNNSYGAAAGQAVYTDYMDEAAANLEAEAYNRWQNEKADQLNMMSLVSGLEERDYNRAYQAERDAKADARYDEELKYNREQNASATEWNRAVTAANMGDFSALKALGINTDAAEASYKSKADYENFAYKLEMFNQTGDKKYLEGLNLDDDSIEALVSYRDALRESDMLTAAQQKWELTHDPKVFEGLGVDTTFLEKTAAQTQYATDLSLAMQDAELGNFAKLKALGFDTTKLESAYNAEMRQAELNNMYNSIALFDQTGDPKVLEGIGLSEEAAKNLQAKYEMAKFAENFAAAYTIWQVNRDSSIFKQFGVDIDTTYLDKIKEDADYEKKFNEAITLATSIGDFSGLKELGVDTTNIEKQWQLALTPAKVTTSGGGGGGGNPPAVQTNPYDYSDTFFNLDEAGAYDTDSAYEFLIASGMKEDEALSMSGLYGTYREYTETYTSAIKSARQRGIDTALDFIDRMMSMAVGNSAKTAAIVSAIEICGLTDAYMNR